MIRRWPFSEGLNPRYRQVVETYGVEVVELPFADGVTDFSEVPDDVSGVFVQSPNFFGVVEDIEAASEAAHAVDALCVAVCDPISLTVLESPGNLGADVAVGEAQPLGMPLLFGGPYAGYMATKKEYVRQLPGRIAGETVDQEGRLAYVLTLRGREQDIRRARANSNICTNQALTALAATVYAALMGPEGMREVAELSASKAHYLGNRLQDAGLDAPLPGCSFPVGVRGGVAGCGERQTRRCWRTASSVGWTSGTGLCSSR